MKRALRWLCGGVAVSALALGGVAWAAQGPSPSSDPSPNPNPNPSPSPDPSPNPNPDPSPNPNPSPNPSAGDGSAPRGSYVPSEPMVLNPARFDDASELKLPPLVVQQERPRRDRALVWIGGLLVLAAAFLWNRSRREALERADVAASARPEGAASAAAEPGSAPDDSVRARKEDR